MVFADQGACTRPGTLWRESPALKPAM